MVDWENRYREGNTPWDKGAPAPGLCDFLAVQSPSGREFVCVPGCGFGHDARIWASAGYQVLGYDLAASAIRGARRLVSAEGVKVVFKRGDFLNDIPPRRFDWIFEHTLFCAIDPSQRPAYVRAVRRWLKPGGKFLSVNYLIPDEDGPPYGTSRAEILDRFSAGFQLIAEWMPRSYPNRSGLERMFLWTLKPTEPKPKAGR